MRINKSEAEDIAAGKSDACVWVRLYQTKGWVFDGQGLINRNGKTVMEPGQFVTFTARNHPPVTARIDKIKGEWASMVKVEVTPLLKPKE